MSFEQNLVKAVKIGLYAVLLTPLFFHRSFVFPFIVPKVFVFQSLIEIIFALWLGLAIFYPQYRPRFSSPVFLVLSALLVILIISSVLGIDFHRSFWSTQERGLGLFALFHFAALFLVLSSIYRGSTSINWRRYFTFSLAVSFIAAFFAVIQLTYPSLFLEKVIERPGSFLGNPTFLAAYLLFNIFIGLLLIDGHRKSKGLAMTQILIAIVVIFEIIVIFLTQTRGALLGLAAGFLALLIYFSIFSHRKTEDLAMTPKLIQRASIIMLLLIVGFVGVFWLTRAAAVWQSIPVLQRIAAINLSDSTAGGLLPRLIALKISWQSFLEKPLLGWGWENFKYPFDRHYDPRLLRSGFTETYFDKPHNVFMEYLATGGALGFLAYLELLGVIFYLIYSHRKTEGLAMAQLLNFPNAKPFLGAALISYLVQNFFVFDTFGSYLMFFVLAAFVDSMSGHRKTEGLAMALNYQSYEVPVRKTGLVGAGTLLIALLAVYFINFKILYANNKQYWGLNYFLNRMPAEALDSYAAALTTKHPYVNQTRRDFAASLSQVYSQGMKIPDIEKIVPKAMEGLALAIKNEPNDYFAKLSFADYSTVFYVFDENYIKLGEELALKALEISPKRQQNYYALAKIRLIQGNKKAALDLIKQAVELDPEVGDPHFYYAFMAFETGDRELGFKELERAKELGRDYKTGGEARVIGNYYADSGDYHNAILYYQLALGAGPDDFESKLKLGIAYFYNSQTDLARATIGEFLKAMPEFRQSPNYEKVRPIVESLNL